MVQRTNISCTETEKVIAHKDSTKFFKDFIGILDLSSPDKILEIYKKLKNKTGISDDEYDIFSLFLEHRNLNKVFTDFSSLRFSMKNQRQEKAISFGELKTHLTEMLINSKLLTILQNEQLRTRIVEVEGKHGICVLDEKRKQHFYELIGDDIQRGDIRDEYYIGKNIRSGKYVIFERETFNIIFTSRDLIILQNGYFSDMMIDTYSNTHIFPHAQVNPVGNRVKYFSDKYHYYIIDFRGNRIHRVDKQHGTVFAESFLNYDIKEVFSGFVICESENMGENPYKIMNISGNCTDTGWGDEIQSYEIIDGILRVTQASGEEKYFDENMKELIIKS